ncbi:CDP-glycerol glycerophosphotransferase family protein [Kitasatospora sp. NPDC057015]|uniref:CDP-glycerol glycerophosphotransferase family protein n=1 Tax=Kitasatospora sp. NPDC057015 TaxID=3346001 RepID=UPI0036425E46
MSLVNRIVLPRPRTSRPAGPGYGDEPEFGLLRARWTPRGLELTGFARPGDLDTARRGSALTWLTLRHDDGRRRLGVRTRPRFLPEITDDSGQSLFNHDWSGFTAVVDPRRLRTDGAWTPGEWQVGATLLTRPGATRLRRQYGTLSPHWCGSGEYPPARWVGGDARILPYFHGEALRLRVERPRARITAARPVDGGVELRGTSGHCPAGTVLRLAHRQSGAVVDLPVGVEGHAFTVRLPFGPFTADGRGAEALEHWDPELRRPDGGAEPLVVDERDGPVAGQHPLAAPDRVLYLKQLADGRLQLCVQPGAGLVDRIAVRPDGFELSGSCPRPDGGPLELVLRHVNGTAELRRPVSLGDGDRFRVHLPATATDSGGTALPLRKGVWEPSLRPAGRDGAERPLLGAPAALPALPAQAEAGGKRILLQRRWHDTVILDSTPVLGAAERSAWTQERLRTRHYPAARDRPLREAVLYDVFSGRGYCDSPRAVHAELARRGSAVEHLWAVYDAQAVVPPGVRAVRTWSPEWYEALATSRYLVGNTHFPDFLERRPGQVVVQTWHGSMLKRIAHDVDNPWLADRGYLEQLDRECPHWSLLVSPSAFATPILRRAFRFRGEILESGYPRNDVLARPDPAAVAEVRRRLGIPDGRRVVLYAPTWREDRQRDNGDGFTLDLRLDVEDARRRLGGDHVLLVRPHAHVREPLPGAGDGFLYDVGDYPDVQELLLIADVLVTDYSSIMFDFAITGRPMLFFTYDLEHYRDTLRGFYFDFEAEAPGPLLRGSAELVDALAALPGAPDPYRERYERFRERFCALEDGGAAGRVVDRMLALGAD